MSSSSSSDGDLKIGDWVHIIDYGCNGQIIDIVGNQYYVDVDDDDAEDDDTVEVFDRKRLRKMC